MEWIQGDFLDIALARQANAIAFTANATVMANGKLVMGRGAAKRIRDALPGVDYVLGTAIRKPDSPPGVQPDYLLAHANVYTPFFASGEDFRVFAVQVKRDWKDSLQPEAKAACWDLTQRSLRRLARISEAHPGRLIVMNCPLIGAAGYARQEAAVREMVYTELCLSNIIVCTI